MPLTITLTSISSGLLKMILRPGDLESPRMPPYHIHLRAFNSKSGVYFVEVENLNRYEVPFTLIV